MVLLAATLLALTAVVVLMSLLGEIGPAGAQDAPASTSSSVRDVIPPVTQQGDAVPSMIPTPNSGVTPTRASDRGGLLQVGLFLVIVLSVVFMVLWVRRSGQRARIAAREGN